MTTTSRSDMTKEIYDTNNDGKIDATAIATAQGDKTFDSVKMTTSPGTAGTGATAVTYGDGKNFVTTLTLAGISLAIAATANEAVGALIYTFPAGIHFHEVTSMNITLQGGGVVDADRPDVGLGSVIGTGAVATLDGTATFEDYITGQTATDCGGTAIPAGPLGATAAIGTGISLNAAADVKALHLNVADGWANADTITAAGTVVLKWTSLV